MKRNKKLLINTSIITLILFSFYYFGGFYFSKDQCILETVRALYGNETEFIMEFENNHSFITLMANSEEKTFSFVGTKKIGFLYHTASSYVNQTIYDTQAHFVSGYFTSEVGMCVMVYRNDPSIHHVEAVFDNGVTMILDEWKNDFVGLLIESDHWLRGTYKAYDINNQLIDEIEY